MDRRTFVRQSVGGAAAAALGAGLPPTPFGAGVPARVLGASDRLRIGLIGCGSRGNYLLEQILRHAPARNLQVTGLCDVWRPNLERTAAVVAGKQTAAPRQYRRYADLLQSRETDAVVIATPDFVHGAMLLDALRAGQDVFVEKPMTTRLEQAREAVRLVRERRAVVQVGTQRRSDARHQAAARLIGSGILGTVSEVETAWHDHNPRWARDYADVRAADVDWEAYLMDLPREPFRPERFRRWHFYEDFTLGTPALLGSHLIDVASWFMDDPLPRSAVAHGGVFVWKDGREHADTLDTILEYPKGFLVNYSTRLGNSRPVPETVFHGTRGTFDTQSWTARGEGGGAGAITEPVFVPPSAAPAPATAATVAGGPQNDPRVAGDDHMLNWLDCVRSRTDPTAPIESGLAHTVASIMSFQALKSGRRQILDPATLQIRAG